MKGTKSFDVLVLGEKESMSEERIESTILKLSCVAVGNLTMLAWVSLRQTWISPVVPRMADSRVTTYTDLVNQSVLLIHFKHRPTMSLTNSPLFVLFPSQKLTTGKARLSMKFLNSTPSS